ncbi:MAG: Cthe_2314 family HEPN domain-containing protein [Bermanella sp.]
MHLINNMILLDEDNPIRRNLEVIDSKLSVKTESDLDYYLLSSSKAYSSITTSIEKAKLSIQLLDYEYILKIESKEHAKSEYIELFIENSIIRVQSIYDRVLIFINRLLELGISNESINHNLIVTNDNVKKYGLDKKLKNLNKTCNEYRNIRNTIIHHDRYTEENLDFFGLVHQSEHLSKIAGRETLLKEETLNDLSSDFMLDYQSDLQGYFEKIEDKLNSIFDSSMIVYATKKVAYKKYNNSSQGTQQSCAPA